MVWSYFVPNLPKESTLNAAGLIKAISVVSDRSRQSITLRLDRYSPNRAVDSTKLHLFVSLSFEKFRLHYPSTASTSDHPTREAQPAPFKESVDYVVRLLRHGIYLNGIQYHFYGHSNSQLKSKSCFLFAGSRDEISHKIEALGEFSKLKAVAKKAKRIGLLFSTAQMALNLQPDRCQDIPDVTRDNYIFTDGCGLISKRLAKLLVQKVDIRYRAKRYTPSVFQIRYRGYKGVLMLEPRLKGQIQAQFRDSMKKFTGGDDLSFSVVEHSKPYSFGVLNDEIILLLSALGVPDANIMRKQESYLQFLSDATRVPEDAFRFLSFVDETVLAERVLLEGIESVQPSIEKLVNREYNKTLNKRDEQRCRILIQQSRLLFGVCDLRNVLKEGECVIRITTEGDGTPRAIVGTEVVVTRNPCLHPGDIQKFRAVQCLDLSHLVDCVVFSTKGRRPSADLMSGGDLDGDKFFVCWDPDVIPPKVAEAAHYQGGKEPVNFKPITDDDRLVYFARYTNASLGRVKNLYMDWARLNGPMCSQCQELNHLFSRCVDGNRIKVPPHLESPPKDSAQSKVFILDKLHTAAKESIQSKKDSEHVSHDMTFDALSMLLSRDNVAMSEFEMVKITARWCKSNDARLTDFLHHFDFTQLTDEERAFVINQVPANNYMPSLAMNDLMHSNLISNEELNHFKLDLHGMRWRCMFDSTRDRLGRLFDVAGEALESFHRKLLVLRVDTRLTIAIYVPRKIEKRTDSVVDDNVRLFAFPHSQGTESMHRRAVPTKIGYRLYYDDTGFQLYEKHRANTWIFLAKPGMDDSSYRGLQNRGDRRRSKEATLEIGLNHDWIASFALNKFSGGLAKHVGRVNRDPIAAAEIYVISNRDVRSLQVLDKWLELIDTDEVLPLFEKDEREYGIPTLVDVNWDSEPGHIRDIAKNGKLLWFESARATEEYLFVFEWLLRRNQNSLLRRIFGHILTSYKDQAHQTIDTRALYVMVDFLTRAPFLVISFVEIGNWQSLPNTVSTILIENLDRLLQAVILNASSMDNLIIEPFKCILAQIPHMSFQALGDLVKTISLVVRSSETALDLLMGALELESSRILTARPLIVEYFIKNLTGIAMEHIDEAGGSQVTRKDHLTLKLGPKAGQVHGNLRIDTIAEVRVAAKDHVRLTAATLPTNSLSTTPYSMDALIERLDTALAVFRCLHPIPSFLEDCSWTMTRCGSFVTTETMFEALTYLAVEQQTSCGIYEYLLCLPGDYSYPTSTERIICPELNQCQNQAVNAALTCTFTCLWGPPGTGKTHTVAVMLEQLLKLDKKCRILVTAPTHNAVDNAMRKFLVNRQTKQESSDGLALRVSTDLLKVASDIRKHTCDAMFGKDLTQHPEERRRAEKQIRNCRLIFSTCIGAGLGLLRNELFDCVIVDEASQQTEPASLVPLIKGCSKAILVGDHVQLRATTQQHAAALDFDVSLFERLYLSGNPNIHRVMLDTQYRMHADICAFSSQEFYQGRLQTAVPASSRPLTASKFPWPGKGDGNKNRIVFVHCCGREDLGRKSKFNRVQNDAARWIGEQLLAPLDPASEAPEPSIAFLTPYTRQAEMLRSCLPHQIVVSSIDGFQGREADIVVFVTVRSNETGEIGFLKDKRRLNVVMTRARAGCIILGDKETLRAGDVAEESTGLWKRLLEIAAEVFLDEESWEWIRGFGTRKG
ncbi:MAG: hypothetical protein Q9167_000505 [Letrouitia subvulpina]